MNDAIFLGFALLLFASIASVAWAENVPAAFTTSVVNKYISATGDLNFSNKLPGFEYRSTLFVSWNIPDEALQGITEDSITVKVVAAAPEGNIYLKTGEGSGKTVETYLECIIADGKCTSKSTLAKEIVVVFTPEEGKPLDNAAITLDATLVKNIVKVTVTDRRQQPETNQTITPNQGNLETNLESDVADSQAAQQEEQDEAIAQIKLNSNEIKIPDAIAIPVEQEGFAILPIGANLSGLESWQVAAIALLAVAAIAVLIYLWKTKDKRNTFR